MQDNYIRLGGPLGVAGRNVPADGTVHRAEGLILGRFRVENAAVVIDGVRHEAGHPWRSSVESTG